MEISKFLKFGTFLCVFSISLGSLAQDLVPLTEAEARVVLEQMANDPGVQAAVDSTPAVYVFPNSKGEESVNYLGQTFRQVLLHDIKEIAYAPTWGEFSGKAEHALQGTNSAFRFQRDKRYRNPYAINGNGAHKITAQGSEGTALEILEGRFYSNIFPKGTSLQAKLAGVDNPLSSGYQLGWTQDSVAGQKIDSDGDGQKTPEEFVDALMSAAAANAASVDSVGFDASNGALASQPVVRSAITPEGLDLAELLQVFLQGSVSLAQATGDYMSIDLGPGKGLLADNSKFYVNDDGVERPYSVLEHHWDEAYGYFGMARDSSQYNPAQIRDGLSLDSFVPDLGAPKDPSGSMALTYKGAGQGDAKVSLIAEKNFGISVNAAARDADSQGQTKFAQNLDTYFREARQLISQKPEGYLKYVNAYGVLISAEWERVMAASAIHHINALQADYANFGTEAYVFTEFAKNFSAMKGFAMTLVFNPKSSMDASSYMTLHTYLKEAPVVPSAATTEADVEIYLGNLEKARDLIAQVYGFTEAQGFSADVLREW